MQKLIMATAAAAFILASGSAMAEDSSQKATTQKTPTQQQMDTQASGGAHMKAQTPAATTGAGVNAGAGMKDSASTTPGKPTDTIKESTGSK
jgi:hypothetical protein